MFEVAARWWRRLRWLVGRSEGDRRMDEEMRFHLEMEASVLRGAGLAAEDANRRARLVFGSVDRFKEEGRDARGTRLIEDVWQDLGYAVRQVRAHPGFAAATILTLALGIGGNTMMNGARRFEEQRRLQSPERLVFLGQGTECVRCARLAAGNYLSIRSQTRALEAVTMFADWDPVLRGPDGAGLVDGVRATTEFFRTFGIAPMLGRTFVPEDSALDRHHVVVLSEAVWRARFAGDSGVLGRTLTLDREDYTVIGVVQSRTVYPAGSEFWTPLALTPQQATDRTRGDYRAVGRLRAGASAPQVSAELAGITAQLTTEFPESMSGTRLTAAPMAERNRLTGGTEIWIFAAAPAVLLLIACVNLAGLLIARLTARQRELAVRRALGAGAGRIGRQLVVETLLLTAAAGVLGAAFAVWGSVGVLGSTGSTPIGRALTVALAMGLLSGLVIGTWPVLRFARPKLVHDLRDSTRSATGSVDRARGRRVLVVAQVSLTIMLLSAAGLLARSFQKQYAIEPGFRVDSVLTMRLRRAPDAATVSPDAERIDRLLRAIEAVPGIDRAGATMGVPYSHHLSWNSFAIEGSPPSRQPPRAALQPATPGYFAALGIPVVSGRGFADTDHAGAARVAVINLVLAERVFPDADPIGRVLVIDSVRWEIVGVVGAVFHGDIDELATPEIYRPMKQVSHPPFFWIAARTRVAPEDMSEAVRAAINTFDPDLAITRLFTMRSLHDNDMGSELRMLRVMGAFALAALLISAIGLYGLISYTAAQRTREFGVRLALGADAAAVLRLVLAQGGRLTAVGALIGLVGAVGVLRVMQATLFGITASDPLALGASVAVIGIVALLAAWVPARRAMRVDPTTSLRDE